MKKALSTKKISAILEVSVILITVVSLDSQLSTQPSADEMSDAPSNTDQGKPVGGARGRSNEVSKKMLSINTRLTEHPETDPEI